MRLKLLVAAIPLMLSLGGCTVHFPLADNGPSLSSQDGPSDSGSNLGLAPTEPNPRDLARGNSAATPDLPR